jgi:hypothetical protein
MRGGSGQNLNCFFNNWFFTNYGVFADAMKATTNGQRSKGEMFRVAKPERLVTRELKMQRIASPNKKETRFNGRVSFSYA